MVRQTRFLNVIGRCCTVTLFLLATMVVVPAPASAGEVVVQPEICRGAGFWGTHSGPEKGGANLGQELLEYAGCVEICGEVIMTTAVNDADSALEALCASPKSGGQIQLARQLTAHALNCILSTGSPECGDSEAWGICNSACAAADPVYSALCNSYYDCTNNGGLWGEGDENGPTCQTGTCSISGAPCGSGLPACPELETCDPTIGCDDADLVSEGFDFTAYEDDASSSNACKRATRSRCAVVGVRETECSSGNESGAPEVCPEQ